MAWVQTYRDEDANPECRAVLDRIRQCEIFAGHVPNVLRALSQRPEVMGGVWDVLRHVTFGGSSLTRQEEEMIATAVSSVNRCHY